MSSSQPDLTALTDEELQDLQRAIREEQTSRRRLLEIPQQVERMQTEYLDARDGPTDPNLPPDWKAPVGADVTDGMPYPLGYTVTHNGKIWRSLIGNNVWTPGDESNPLHYTLWIEVTDDEEPGGVPEWSGLGVSYAEGDIVTYEGQEYRCRQPHQSQPGWTPSAAASLWLLIGDDHD